MNTAIMEKPRKMSIFAPSHPGDEGMPHPGDEGTLGGRDRPGRG